MRGAAPMLFRFSTQRARNSTLLCGKIKGRQALSPNAYPTRAASSIVICTHS
jgi:hypothetical protein